MNKQTEQFLNALKDIEEGKVVPLDKALNEQPPSKELQKIFKDIEQMDAEREAWKKMFDLQTKLVTNLELDKIKLEKEIEGLKETIKLQKHVADVGAEELEKEIKGLKKEVEMYKDIVRLSKHIEEERINMLKKENETLQGYLNNINSNLKKITGEE